jgi:hypothetical protein
MDELTAPETTADACCAPEQQASCCEPSAKADCCDSSHGEGCGCAAGSTATQQFAGVLADADLADVEIRETHRVHTQAASGIVRASKPSERPT